MIGYFPNRRFRRGLAPLEFVLALPILLFVMALIVNFGTAATWRLRGEIASRDAVWGQTHPRSPQDRPNNWPINASYHVANDQPIEELDDPAINHEVVRGPKMGDVTVNPILDPNRDGMRKGISEVERQFALLPSLGEFDSGAIENSIIETKWQCNDEGYQNWFRRSKLLYEWPEPDVSGLESAYASAVQNLRGYWQSRRKDALEVVEWDYEFHRVRRRGRGPDFHPRPRRGREIDPEVVRIRNVERYLIDYKNERDEYRAGRITMLPSQLTSSYLGLYRGRKRELEQLIEELENADPQPAGAAQQIAAAKQEIQTDLDPKIEQLEAYQKRLPDINRDLARMSPCNQSESEESAN